MADKSVKLHSVGGVPRTISVPGGSYDTDADGMIELPDYLVAFALQTNFFEIHQPKRRAKKASQEEAND